MTDPNQIPPSRGSTAIEKAKEDNKLKTTVVSWVGVLLGGLIVAVAVLAFKDAKLAEHFVVSAVPIISGGIFGLVGFVAGQKIK